MTLIQHVDGWRFHLYNGSFRVFNVHKPIDLGEVSGLVECYKIIKEYEKDGYSEEVMNAERGDGRCICKVCNKKYKDHRLAPGFTVRLCSGELVKL